MKKKLQAAGLAAVLTMSLAGCSLPFSEYSIPQTEIGSGSNIPERVEPVLKEQTSTQEKSGRLTSAENLADYVVLGEYKGLVLNEPEADDAQVEEEIQRRLAKDSSNMRGDAEVQEGDTVLINYVGTVNHKILDGSIANNYSLVIGSGEMADGFEEALIGMKLGQTRSFSITYPEGGPWPDLAGVTADYRVTLQSFTRPAQLTEEWAQEQGAESVEDLRASIRRELTDTLRLSDDALRAQAWSRLMGSAKILDYPPEDLEKEKDAYQSLTERYAREAEMSLTDYLTSQGMTRDEFEEQKTVYARQKTAQNLVLQAIMDSEGMNLSDEASLRVQERLVKAAGKGSVEELEEAYGQPALDESIALERVLDFVTEHRDRPEA